MLEKDFKKALHDLNCFVLTQRFEFNIKKEHLDIIFFKYDSK